MADGSTYGGLDMSVPEFTARTRLYHQAPIGIGTPMVESLTGYIVRLAEAHAAGALIFKELGRCVGPDRTGFADGVRYYSTFTYDARSLNGMTDRTEKWVAAVSAATGVENLRFLTMLPWKQVFSAQGITRMMRAWCARCYREWQAAGTEIHEPLLWMLARVSICPLHQQILTTICPYCGREPHVLSCTSRPGHCSRCGGWLGVNTDERDDAGGAADPNRELSLAEAFATLLARAPTLEQPPSVELVKINLRACVDELAGGNENLFLRAAGLGPKTLAEWLSGHQLPRLDSLLTVCLRLGIPLYRFITEPVSFGAGGLEYAREVVARHQAFRWRRASVVRAALTEALQAAEPRSLSDIARQVGFKHEASLRRYDPEAFEALLEREQALNAVKDRSDAADSIPRKRIEGALKIALGQDPPPSARDVSLSLGLPSASWLEQRFRDSCRLLVQRSKEYRRSRRLDAENALRAALVEEPPPTVSEVAARVGHRSGQTLQRWFPDLYATLAARSSRRRDWRLARLQSILETAVTQEPPPSGEAVATAAGVTCGHLRRLFPNLWREVVARHAIYSKQQNARNRDAFQETVRMLAQEILRAGEYPSRRKVRALLPESRLRGGHLIVREVKKVVVEFSGRA